MTHTEPFTQGGSSPREMPPQRDPSPQLSEDGSWNMEPIRKDPGFRGVSDIEWMTRRHLGGETDESGEMPILRAGDFMPGPQQILAGEDIAEGERMYSEAGGMDKSSGEKIMGKGLANIQQAAGGVGMLPVLGGIATPPAAC